MRGAFWRRWLQADLFAGRTAVGREVSAELVVTPNVSAHSTAIQDRPNSTLSGRQVRLPLTAARR